MVIRRRDVDAETQIYIDFEANKKQLRSSTDTNLEQLRAKMMQLRCMVDGRTSTIVPEFSRAIFTWVGYLGLESTGAFSSVNCS